MSSIFSIPEQYKTSSGIYVIRNTTNNKIYVGSAVNVYTRFQIHFANLKANRHVNRHLQASFNKNGGDVFTFALLEVVENKEDLLLREQHYIDTLQPHYNIAKQAGRPPLIPWTDEMREKHKITMLNRVIPEESRQRMREAAIRTHTGRKASPETRAKLSAAMTGKVLSEEHKAKCRVANLGKKHTEEAKQKVREANSNHYIVVAHDSTRYEVTDGLLTFANTHGLDESALASCARGEYKHHKGWQCWLSTDFTEDKIQDPASFRIAGQTVYRVTTPDGTEEITNNLYEYAREHDLDGSSLNKVFRGQLNHCKGYKVREDGTEPRTVERKKSVISPANTHHYICTTPDGIEYTTTNIPEFAREHGICKESMRNVAKGRLRQYKGWLCRYTPETLAKLTSEQQAEIQANFEYQAKYPGRKPISSEDRQMIMDASRTPEALEKRSKARKGWKPNDEQLNNLSLGHCKRTFVVTTPEGEEITTKQLVQFAKERNMSHSGLYKAARNGVSCKGYTVREITE